MTIVEVKLWGTLVGKLAYNPNNDSFTVFEYTKEILEAGLSLSPIKLPTTSAIYYFPEISYRTFKGLPGFIADSLPDKYGNQLIDQYFADKGLSEKEITSLDRLLYVGNRSMGALEYEPSTKINSIKKGATLDLQSLSELADLVMSKKEAFAKELSSAQKEQAIALLRIGSSAGGARAKALVALDSKGKLYDGTIEQNKDCKYYLLKFDSSENKDRDSNDPKGMTRVEYIYSLIARECDIDLPETSFIETNNGEDFHFLIERFDRVINNDKLDKLHYVSWCGMEHADRDTTGAYSYEQLVVLIRQMGLGQDSIKELFRRAVFNIIGRNQDDHTKNFGFLMNRVGEWSLSPAFDLTFSYDPSGNWTKVHQIKLNGKQDEFTRDDIISFAKKCNIKKSEANKILDKTVEAFKGFSKLAIKYNISNELAEFVEKNLRTEI